MADDLDGGATGGLGLAIASAKDAWAKRVSASEPARVTLNLDDTHAEGSNLLTDPRYSTGGKYRLGRFIGRGADPAEAEAVFRRLPNLDAEPRVAEWTPLSRPWPEKDA